MRTPNLSVVIPTYREAENLTELITRIMATTTQADISTEIVVVDDNSPDNTRAVCERLAESFPVRLIVREHERGLASAVIAGMNAADGEVLMCMDADLSHAPESIPDLYVRLMERDDSGTTPDFVIGSRYTAGGGMDQDWGWFRRLNSRFATWLAKPLTGVSDPMSGFFAIRKERFESADALNPLGFKIGLELIVKCRCQSIAEVPIQFHDRLHGDSKLSLREQVNYLRHLKRLYGYRWPHRTGVVLFGAVGLTGFAVDMIAFLILIRLVPLELAAAMAIWLAMSWNYVLNRVITFSETPRRPWLAQYLQFCGSCLLGGICSGAIRVGLVLQWEFFAQQPIWAALCGVFVSMAFNYCLCRFLVFCRPDHVFRPLVPQKDYRTRTVAGEEIVA